tara:strand:+ start:79 stop:501 length:423 start_codon:yes stop_codon:yes gene_type:complete
MKNFILIFILLIFSSIGHASPNSVVEKVGSILVSTMEGKTKPTVESIEELFISKKATQKFLSRLGSPVLGKDYELSDVSFNIVSSEINATKALVNTEFFVSLQRSDGKSRSESKFYQYTLIKNNNGLWQIQKYDRQGPIQ